MRFKSVMETNDIQKKIDWIFRLYDINGDGKLSKSEANRISTILVQKLINIVFENFGQEETGSSSLDDEDEYLDKDRV